MIIYRKIQSEDYKDIVEICQDIWDGADYLPDFFEGWLLDEGCFLGGIDTETNQVIVVGKYSILPDGSGWLEGLRVHPRYRGKGLSKDIILRLLNMAKVDLEKGLINKIAFSTHISSAASIHTMKQLNFKLRQEHITLTKDYDALDTGLRLEDFHEEPWGISFEAFQQLKYFQDRDQYIPLAFVFQTPNFNVFQELKESGAFVKINGVPGIYKFKGEPYFIALNDDFASINTFMNYYCLKNRDRCKFTPITTILPKRLDLISQLKQAHFTVMNNWQPDYYYFVYEP